MTKKAKLLIAVLAALMCLSLGLFVACNGDTHTHSYTQWAYNDTQHWKVCPDDGAIDESSYGEHVFVAGECECGATQQSEAKEYGTVSGSVTLCTIGEVSTDYTGVTIDLGDDNAVVDFDSASGAFTIENVEVGRAYTLTVSKTGYASYQGGVLLSEAGEEVDLGEVVLESNSAFTTGSIWASWGWVPTIWGHTSAEEHYFTQGGSNTVAVQSVKGYEQVAVTLTVKCSNTTNGEGIWFFFEDGSVCPVFIYADHRIEWDLSTGYKDWGGEGAFDGADNNHFANVRDNWSVIDGDGNDSYSTANISDELKAKHDAGTLELTLVRDGADFYLFIDGKLGEKTTIESEYAEELVYVGFYAKDVVKNSTWQYRIETDISEYVGAANLAIDKTGEGNVTYDPATEYKVGDTVTLTLAPASGYHIGSLVIDGTDKTELIEENESIFTYTYRVDTLAPEIDVTFAKDVVVDAVFDITGVKYGVSGNSIADNTTVTLLGRGGMQNFTGTVNSGTATIQDVVAGTYTLSVDGYLTQEITVNEDGSADAVTLEWVMFEDVVPATSLGWPAAIYDFTNVNKGEFTFSNTWGIGLLSNESFEGDFAASLLSISGNHTNKEFVVLRFEDGAYVAISSCYSDGNFRLEYLPSSEGLGWGNDSYPNPLETNITKNTWNPTNAFGEELYSTGNTSAELADLKAKWESGGFNLTLVKKGATIYFFADDTFIDCFTVDAKYADMSFRFGYYVWDPARPSTWNYGYTQDVSSYFDDELTLTAAADIVNGSVSFDKNSYAAGETATITIAPEENYILESILVDGHEMIGSVSGNTLKVRVDSSYEVEAVFAPPAQAEVEISLIGNKYGVEGSSIEDGTKVVLQSDRFGDIECEVTGGKIAPTLSYVFSEDETYTVIVEGYAEKTFTVGADGASVTEITLEYEFFENLTLAWGWGDSSDLSKQNEGIITHTTGGTQWVSSNDSYQSVAITATVVAGGQRQGVFIRFAGASFAEDGYMMIQKEWDSHVSWNGEGNIWGFGTNLCTEWTGYVNPLTDDDKAKIAAGKYELTLVRDANKVHVFINGTYYDTKVLNASYADLECYVGIYCTTATGDGTHDGIIGKERTFRIEDASVYLKNVVITDETASDANGSLTVTENVRIGDTVSVTFNANSGYMISTLTVDGSEIELSGLQGNTYTFTAKKETYTIAATFEQIQRADVTLSVTGAKHGVSGNSIADGAKVVLKTAFFADVETSVADGKIVVNDLPYGSYTASVEGYFDVAFTVGESGASVDELAFEYQMFESLVGWDWDKHDFTHVNDENAYITYTGASGTLNVLTADSYTNVSATLLINWNNSKYSTHTQGIILRFADGKHLIVRYHNGDQNGNIQYCNAAWAPYTSENTLFNANANLNQWGENPVHNLTDDERTAITSGEGIELKVEIKDGALVTSFGGEQVATYTLPEGYADQAVQVGYFTWDTAQNAVIRFSVGTAA